MALPSAVVNPHGAEAEHVVPLPDGEAKIVPRERAVATTGLGPNGAIDPLVEEVGTGEGFGNGDGAGTGAGAGAGAGADPDAPTI